MSPQPTKPASLHLLQRSHPQGQGKTILFAYEEAIGFGPGDVVFEKVRWVCTHRQGTSCRLSFFSMCAFIWLCVAVSTQQPLRFSFRTPSPPGLFKTRVHNRLETRSIHTSEGLKYLCGYARGLNSPLCSIVTPPPPPYPLACCFGCMYQDGLSSAALFAEMRVALHDRDQDGGVEEGATTSSRTPSSSLSSLASPAGPPAGSGGGAVATTSKWSSGVAAVKAAATAPSSMFLTRGNNGSKGKDDKSPAEAPLYSPPSSPSTVGASPPASPSAGGGHLRDSTDPRHDSPAFVVATGDIEPAAAAAVGVEGEQDKRGCSSVLLRRLKSLHERYGEFAEENGYVRCEDAEVKEKRKKLRRRRQQRFSALLCSHLFAYCVHVANVACCFLLFLYGRV